jgi:dTDP-4-amino-4,6-dideoxygalactose transaminase
MNKYSLAFNSWDDKEIDAINRVVSTNQFTMGPSVKEFEKKLANFHGVKHCIMTNSGSSANLVATYAVTFKKFGFDLLAPNKGTVIVPTVSWSTTYFPLMQLGYKLKFIDVDKTYNIDVDKLKLSIDADTVGVFSVNLLGVSAENEKIRHICDERGLFFLEDNCESFGAKLGSKMCGTFGDAGTLSFFFSHHLQTMEGGAILTDCDDIERYSRSLRAHGWTRDGTYPDLIDKNFDTPFDKNFQFILPGFCVRPIEISGEVGLEQLRKWPAQERQRKLNYDCFSSQAEKRSYLSLQSGRGEPTWFGFGIVFDADLNISRNEIYSRLLDHGVESRPIVAGNFTKQPVVKFVDHSVGKTPMSDKIDEYGMFLGNDGRDLTNQIHRLFSLLDGILK